MKRYFTAYPSDADKVILCIKGGVVDMKTVDCSAENMRRSIENCNHILDGKKSIDLFGPARVDPKIPIEKTVEAIAELAKEGKVGGILLSEVSAETLRKAAKIHHIGAIEAEISLWATDVFQNGVAETCKELGTVLLAHSPLGRGMLAGNFSTLEDVANGESHSMFPRFQGENFEQNLKLVRELQRVAGEKGCTNAQLALAWLRDMSKRDHMPVIVPIAGARSNERVAENCEDIELTDAEVKEIDAALARLPIARARYPASAAKLLEY